ncbi:MAG TPA: polyketide cyclase, partial [Sphingobacteriaceae bacterium]|nr:polyketide cyclase [Sphingobacteriaceae bacterium]
MKTVKKIIIVVGIIVVIPFIIAFLVPKSFKSERSIQIDQPRQQVFEYVRFVRNQDHFGVWQ